MSGVIKDQAEGKRVEAVGVTSTAGTRTCEAGG